MSRAFPTWISKTYWRNSSVQVRMNILQVCAAVLETSLGLGSRDAPYSTSATMAFARGLPERRDAKWLKVDEVPNGARSDLVLLASRVRRMLRAEARAEKLRDIALKVKQAACAHDFEDIPGTGRRYCHICTLTVGVH